MSLITKIMGKFSYLFFLLRVFTSGDYQRSKIYSKYYGVSMGKNVRITGFLHFPTESFLISIGDSVTLTNDITFHTHDGGVGVLRDEFQGINVFGKISIGNNVFIGSNTIILPNVRIGSNVVVGAGSVVAKDIPDNVVAAGNPAKVIRTLNEYKQKTLAKGVYVRAIGERERKKEILQYFNTSESKTD